MCKLIRKSKKNNNIVFLFHDNFKLNPKIQEHMEFVAELKEVNLVLLWGLKKFKNYLNGNLKDICLVITLQIIYVIKARKTIRLKK